MPEITDRSDIRNQGRFCHGIMRCTFRAPRGVVRAANTSRLAPAGRRSGSCECFIDMTFNACLKAMFLQDKYTDVS